jgi:molybdopterin/thiamine biosynthesis adenylyltransferase/rhodanese-related sulfurtransferase
MNATAINRYARQTMLPDIGPQGQARIAAANVLVIGAGGLGCAVLQYLCAAGIGRLAIVDHDRVEETNLHRQPLYRMTDIGRPKAEAARDALIALNPEVDVHPTCERLTPANASALVAQVDIVVDAADSFAVTYTLSDACMSAGKSLVSASVLGLSGYAGVFCRNAPSYRAIFPDIPAQVGSCATAGVLGTAVGVIGTLQAHLTLSMVLGLTPTAAGRLITFDFRTLRIGGFSFAEAREPAHTTPHFIAPSQVSADDVTVDLRGVDEAPVPAFPSSLRISPDSADQLAAIATPSKRLVLCCRSGIRAWRVATTLRARGITNLALIALGD